MAGARLFYTGVTTVTTGATKLFSANLDAEMRSISPGAGVLYIGMPLSRQAPASR